jgi:hypothetical protein
MTACGTRAAGGLLALHALLLTGCTTIAKQAFHEVRGAQGEVLLITESRPSGLARYQGLQFTPATSTVGSRICPPELLRAYDRSASQAASKLRADYPGGSPALTIDSEILYFQRKGFLSGAIMLTRVKLRSSDQPVLDAVVRAESDAFRAGGEEDLAQASLDALCKFLEKHKNPKRND